MLPPLGSRISSGGERRPLGHVQGFQGFPLVRIANAFFAPRKPQVMDERQVALWWEARKGTNVSKVPVDKTEHSYWVEEGPFVASRLPSTLPIHKQTLDTDTKLHQAQQNWHLLGAIICKGIILVGSAT